MPLSKHFVEKMFVSSQDLLKVLLFHCESSVMLSNWFYRKYTCNWIALDGKFYMNSLTHSLNSDSLSRFGRGLVLSPIFANVISWLLVLAIIVMSSLFSWSVWEYFQPRENTLSSIVTSTEIKSKTVDIKQLTSYHLFGNPKTTQAPITDQINAPVSRLKLKLRGVYATADELLASAMIEAKNKQENYSIGDKLPGAAGLKLHSIQSDRVIMSRGGKFETLIIEDFGKLEGLTTNHSNRSNVKSTSRNEISPSNSTNNVLDKRKDANLTKELVELRSKLSDPQSLSELISVSPATEDEQFIGFRLAPGKNRALFGRLGLRRNDIVTNVNGITLDDPATAFTLMEQISTAEEIDLTIQRGDRVLNILFSAATN
ncbi:MAG: general secretion pathway protein C [Enterobacterales bacterium]|jgi:general secretion pathway protein C